MPLTFAVFLVVALMTSVLVLVGTFPGVQPSSRLSCGPSVEPLGPQLESGMTPVFLTGSNAPAAVGLFGSVTSRPPWQKDLPPEPSKAQPTGLLAIWGIDV